jgi:trehalose 6-phosphate phosphatase
LTNILARQNADTLARFLSARALLAFDFDGTLAPIVSDRAAARMRRRTLRLLDQVCRLFPCAVISGRRRDDVLDRLEGLPVRHVVGNHGLRPEAVDSGVAALVAAAGTALGAALGGLEGVEVENKTYSLAVHYRLAPDRRSSRAEIVRALGTVSGGAFRIIPGKRVFDLVPREAPHKGAALTQLCETERVPAAVYVGDDATDEDVFRLADPSRLLSIRVGRSLASAALYYVRDQRDLDAFLERIVRASGR